MKENFCPRSKVFCLVVIVHLSVTRLGYFSKLLATNFVIKVAQISGNNLGNFVVYHIFRKKCFGYFLGNIGKLGLLLIPTFGHTGPPPPMMMMISKSETRLEGG